jgi:hypothetical protein
VEGKNASLQVGKEVQENRVIRKTVNSWLGKILLLSWPIQLCLKERKVK